MKQERIYLKKAEVSEIISKGGIEGNTALNWLVKQILRGIYSFDQVSFSKFDIPLKRESHFTVEKAPFMKLLFETAQLSEAAFINYIVFMKEDPNRIDIYEELMPTSCNFAAIHLANDVLSMGKISEKFLVKFMTEIEKNHNQNWDEIGIVLKDLVRDFVTLYKIPKYIDTFSNTTQFMSHLNYDELPADMTYQIEKILIENWLFPVKENSGVEDINWFVNSAIRINRESEALDVFYGLIRNLATDNDGKRQYVINHIYEKYLLILQKNMENAEIVEKVVRQMYSQLVFWKPELMENFPRFFRSNLDKLVEQVPDFDIKVGLILKQMLSRGTKTDDDPQAIVAIIRDWPNLDQSIRCLSEKKGEFAIGVPILHKIINNNESESVRQRADELVDFYGIRKQFEDYKKSLSIQEAFANNIIVTN